MPDTKMKEGISRGASPRHHIEACDHERAGRILETETKRKALADKSALRDMSVRFISLRCVKNSTTLKSPLNTSYHGNFFQTKTEQ
jgi:hypothetical protein